MSPVLTVVLAALALAALCPLCINHHSPAIEADLLTRSKAALESAGIASAGLTMDGREARLRGFAGSPEIGGKARRIVEETWGVRTVTIEELQRPPAPAPSAAVVEVQKKLDEMIRLRNVEFETASAKLTAKGRAILDEVAATLQRAGTVTVDIQGHTDADGDAAVNMKLSKDRAASVQQYLTGKGIAADRMTTAGFGQTQPIADNNTPEGKQANRRIEFKVKER